MFRSLCAFLNTRVCPFFFFFFFFFSLLRCSPQVIFFFFFIGGSDYQTALNYIVQQFLAKIRGDASRVLPTAINVTDIEEFVPFWEAAFEVLVWKIDSQVLFPLSSSHSTISSQAGLLSSRELKLWDAVSNNRVNLVREYLRSKWVNINFAHPKFSMNSLLHLACEKGHVGIVFELLQCASIDVNKVNKNRITPLSLVCQCGRIEVACLLLRDLRVDSTIADAKNWTPLLISHIQERMDRVIYLMAATRRFSNVNSSQEVTHPAFGVKKPFPVISFPLSLEDWEKAGFEGLGTIARELGITFEIFGQSTDFRNPSAMNLSGIGLSNLSGRISFFPNLTTLTLRGNRLHDLPEELNSLPLLVTLDVSENILKGLGGHVACLDRLTDLNISENLVGEAEMLQVLQHSKKLVNLDISGNPLSRPTIFLEVAAFIKGNLCLESLRLVQIPIDSKGCSEIIRSLEWNYSEGILTLKKLE